MVPNIITGLILFLSYLTCMFLIVQVKQDNTIGNFTWGGGVFLLTLYSFFASATYLPRQTIITLLVSAWFIRLASYAYIRYKPGSDPRFQSWQKYWGKHGAFAISFIWIYILNGFFAIIMSLPILSVNLIQNQASINYLDILAVILWITGFYWESVGDYQLYKFLHNSKNKGKIMDQGLWKYSRHPNYFGEILMWWSIFLLVLSVPYGWLTIVAPLGITFTLIFVTGIPLLERVFENNPEYQEYKKCTSVLIPWWPKNN